MSTPAPINRIAVSACYGKVGIHPAYGRPHFDLYRPVSERWFFGDYIKGLHPWQAKHGFARNTGDDSSNCLVLSMTSLSFAWHRHLQFGKPGPAIAVGAFGFHQDDLKDGHAIVTAIKRVGGVLTPMFYDGTIRSRVEPTAIEKLNAYELWI